jgi:tRNA(Arg) A34 adenosine deaminase TadA
MTIDDIQILGRKRLQRIVSTSAPVNRWKAELAGFQPAEDSADEPFVWLCCVLALESAHIGNFGVGSVLVDEDGTVLVHDHNRVFRPYFRSDRHAEMVVMDEFEDRFPDLTDIGGYTLYSSLEPCPMCLVRLSTSRIARIRYAAPDIPGGMVHEMERLPPFWKDLVAGKVFAQAHCSQTLIRAADAIFQLNLGELLADIKKG